MKAHVKAVGWLWIIIGLVSVLLLATGAVVINISDLILDPDASFYVTLGALCLSLPVVIAEFVAGGFILQYKSWARILAIILAIYNIVFLCWLLVPAILGIYTLVILFNEEAKALFNGAETSV